MEASRAKSQAGKLAETMFQAAILILSRASLSRGVDPILALGR